MLSPWPAASVATTDPSQPWRPSTKATVPSDSPEASRGSHSSRAASSPQWSSNDEASTAEEKNGAHSNARPISSSTMASSRKP